MNGHTHASDAIIVAGPRACPACQAEHPERSKYFTAAATMRTETTLANMLRAARELNEGSENPEYARGQAELIMDTFGLLPHDAYRMVIYPAITGDLPVVMATRSVHTITQALSAAAESGLLP